LYVLAESPSYLGGKSHVSEQDLHSTSEETNTCPAFASYHC
jgi:hypothetical protein